MDCLPLWQLRPRVGHGRHRRHHLLYSDGQSVRGVFSSQSRRLHPVLHNLHLPPLSTRPLPHPPPHRRRFLLPFSTRPRLHPALHHLRRGSPSNDLSPLRATVLPPHAGVGHGADLRLALRLRAHPTGAGGHRRNVTSPRGPPALVRVTADARVLLDLCRASRAHRETTRPQQAPRIKTPYP